MKQTRNVEHHHNIYLKAAERLEARWTGYQ